MLLVLQVSADLRPIMRDLETANNLATTFLVYSAFALTKCTANPLILSTATGAVGIIGGANAVSTALMENVTRLPMRKSWHIGSLVLVYLAVLLLRLLFLLILGLTVNVTL